MFASLKHLLHRPEIRDIDQMLRIHVSIGVDFALRFGNTAVYCRIYAETFGV